MDLREIQALHARYSDSPVVIDLPGQYARIPIPMLAARAAPRTAAASTVREWAKWVGVAILALGAAGVVGTQAGHIWQHFHRARPARDLKRSTRRGKRLIRA